MPEGPSIIFLQNKLRRFNGKIVTEATGDIEMGKDDLANLKLIEVSTFGENLLFVFQDFFIAVQPGAFGSMLVNKQKKMQPSFALQFQSGEINFYAVKTKRYAGKPSNHFDFRTDILKPQFDPDFIIAELQSNHSEEQIGDVLMNQQLFAGVGNIIRVESLYHAKIHPESIVAKIPEKKLKFLLSVITDYAEEFLILLKTDSVKEKALIYGKKICPKDKTPLVIAEMGKIKRKTYVCPKCQKLFV